MKQPLTKEKFGKILRTFREAAGLSQAALGKPLGLRQSSIAGYEDGVSFPSLDNLDLLADILGVSLDELAGRQPKNRPLHATLRPDQRKLIDLFERMRNLIPDVYDIEYESHSRMMEPFLAEYEASQVISVREAEQMYIPAASDPELRVIAGEEMPAYNVK